MVNRQGKRFTNEAQPYEDFVKAQYASESRGEGAIPCYLVFRRIVPGETTQAAGRRDFGEALLSADSCENLTLLLAISEARSPL